MQNTLFLKNSKVLIMMGLAISVRSVVYKWLLTFFFDHANRNYFVAYVCV